MLVQSLVSLWCSFQHLCIAVHHHVKVLQCMALFISPNTNTASACCLCCVEGRVFQRQILEGRWPSTAALLHFWQLWEKNKTKHLFAFKLVLVSANPAKSLNPTNSRWSMWIIPNNEAWIPCTLAGVWVCATLQVVDAMSVILILYIDNLVGYVVFEGFVEHQVSPPSSWFKHKPDQMFVSQIYVNSPLSSSFNINNMDLNTF